MLPDYLDIPIFPLPNVTFFPQTYLPLHVFEPRYRTMVENALAGDRLLGVALLKEGWQANYFGHPPICKTFGLGRIVDHERTGDGRYNIVLEGLFRVRLIQEFPTSPFRTGRVQVLLERAIDGRREEVSSLTRELREVSGRLARLVPDSKEIIAAAWNSHLHPLVVANQLAGSLVVDAYDRQSILEQDDPLRRMRLVLIQLGMIAMQLSGGHVHEEVAEEE